MKKHVICIQVPGVNEPVELDVDMDLLAVKTNNIESEIKNIVSGKGDLFEVMGVFYKVEKTIGESIKDLSSGDETEKKRAIHNLKQSRKHLKAILKIGLNEIESITENQSRIFQSMKARSKQEIVLSVG
jgi:hypothetical protein